MKSKKLIAFIVVLSAVLYGCKKNIPVDQPAPGITVSYEKAKTWFESRTKTVPGKYDARMGKPDWEKTKYYPGQGVYITPVKLGNKNTGEASSVYKLILTRENPQGIISSANYLYVVPGKEMGKSSAVTAQDLTPDLLSLENPKNFSGTIIKYDLDYNIESSKHIGNGQILNKNEKIATGINGQYEDLGSPESASSVLACGECDSYYLITYDEQGNIISIEYLYTECGECPGDGGGGGSGGNGGGNGPSPCDMTQAQMQTALNNITCTVYNDGWGVIGQPGAPDQNGIIRAPKNCKGGGLVLHILSGYTPKWFTTYSGIIYKENPNDAWKWESIAYTGFPQTEGVLPPCVSANATATSAQVISEDKSKVTTAGSYTCNVYWTCALTTGVRTFTGPINATLYADVPIN